MQYNVEELEIEVYERVGNAGFKFQMTTVYETISSLRVNWRYQSFDTFTMRVPLDFLSISIFKVDNLVLIQDEFFYVDKALVDKDTDKYMTVSGKSLVAKAMMRIIERTYQVASKEPERIAFDLLSANVSNANAQRKIHYIRTQSAQKTFTGKKTDFQNTYGNVFEQIETLMLAYDFGLKEKPIDYDNPAQEVEFYRGRNVSNAVEFSKGFENLLVESYENSNDDERTTAYALGEGEGNARKKVMIAPSLQGLERKEIYVDARDLQMKVTNEDGTETTLNNAQYEAVLKQRANEKLAERAAMLELNGTIDLTSELFVFGRDYFVGDRVRITSELFGLTKTSVITEIEEVWDGGHSLEPTFGHSSPTLIDKLKRR